MKNWLLGIISIIFIIIVFSIFLPESKVGKYAKSIISIFILLIIILPLSKKNILTNEDEIFLNEEVYVQEDFLYFINDYKMNLVKEKCNKILEDLEIKNALINVDFEITENYNFFIKKIEINLSESVINSTQSHKYIIEEIKNQISKQVLINKESIEVYE